MTSGWSAAATSAPSRSLSSSPDETITQTHRSRRRRYPSSSRPEPPSSSPTIKAPNSYTTSRDLTGRSCHTAIAEAKQHVRQGYEWVVDIDLEKFFDRVNHQRLLARLAQRVCDRRLLVLIGRMLKAKVVLPDGVVIGVDEGVPQGSPLS